MPVTADSYEARVSEALVEMLAYSANFQAMVGVLTGIAAKGFIVEDDAGISPKAVDGTTLAAATASFAIVRLGESRRVERAAFTYGREGAFTIELLARTQAADTPAEAVRRGRNVAGLIAADLVALIGSASIGGAGKAALLYATFDVGDVMLASQTGARRGATLVPITGSWRDLP